MIVALPPVEPVEVDERAEIGGAQRVAVQREERPVEIPGGVTDAAARAERLVLDAILEAQLAVRRAEVRLDLRRHVAARDDRATNAVLPQVLEGVGEERPVDERQHVLARRLGERAQARPLPPDEDHRRKSHALRPMPS